jgi:tetratricopeptide (TPR) repeat protein
MYRRNPPKPPAKPADDVLAHNGITPYLRQFLEWSASMNYSPRTIEHRDYSTRRFIAWCDQRGLTRPHDITRPILERYRQHLYHYRKEEKLIVSEYMPRGKAKEKFAEAGLLSEIETGPFGKPEEAAKVYYDLRDRLEEEARMMETVYAQQARGATTQFEKELTNIVEDWRRDFKTKFQQDDYEIHFQLGVAFMEQGLYNEAIEELTIAAKDEARTLECYCIISYCHRQRKSYVDAVKWLKRALLLAPSGSDSYYALEYELGLLYEELRTGERAPAFPRCPEMERRLPRRGAADRGPGNPARVVRLISGSAGP